MSKVLILDYPIINGCINARMGKSNIKNFQILLNDKCSYAILMVTLTSKINRERDYGTKWKILVGGFITNQ